MMLNRDGRTITIDGVDVPVLGWGVISIDDGARQFPIDEYAYAHEYAEAVSGILAPIIDLKEAL